MKKPGKKKTVKKKRKYKQPEVPSSWIPSLSAKHPGRPPKYKPEFCQSIIDYFNRAPYKEVRTPFGIKRIANDFPTLYGFAAVVGATYDNVTDWVKKYPEFSHAVNQSKAIAAQILITNGLLELYSGRFAMLVATNYTNLKVKEPAEAPRTAILQIIQVPPKYVPQPGEQLLPVAAVNDIVDGRIEANEDDSSGKYGAIDYTEDVDAA